MKKFFFSLAFILLLVGCAQPGAKQSATNQPSTSEQPLAANITGKCMPGSVDLAGYGDKGKRLANCFVQYPGEPSRQDKSYYIVEDICGQFTKEFMENILGQKIAFTKGPLITGLYNCSYYYNDKDYVMLVLDYLGIDNQKKGQEFMGRKVMVDDKIPMENFYAVQDNGIINTLYFVLNPNKFISIERSSSKVLEGDEVLRFAEKLGSQIKGYK